MFPVFAQAREKARQASCASNLKQIGLGLMQYTQDYDEKMPLSFFRPDPGPVNERYSWRYAVQPYVKSKQLFSCPSYRYPDAFFVATVNAYAGTKDAIEGVPLGYAGSHSWAGWTTNPGQRHHPSLSIASVSRPATIIMAFDSKLEYSDLSNECIRFQNWGGMGAGKGMFISHQKRPNWLFFDGHVKALQPCSTFGALAWNPGDVPPDDYLWEWWSDPNPNVLRDWRNQCGTIAEYK